MGVDPNSQDLIIQAEKSLREDRLEEAERLTILARENCLDMINYAKIRGNRSINPLAGAAQMLFSPFVISMLHSHKLL